MNRRFTLMDLLKQTLHLIRVRWGFFLILLATFIVSKFLMMGSRDLLHNTAARHPVMKDQAARHSCEQNILVPWRTAAMTNNLSSSQQEGFYNWFQLNCTMFSSPASESGFFSFTNGTFTMTSAFALKRDVLPHSAVLILMEGLSTVWTTWAQVAIAWGLLLATHAAMGYTRPPHSGDISVQVPSTQKLTKAFKEQFSYMVLRGVVRVSLTESLAACLSVVSLFFISGVRVIVGSRSLSWEQVVKMVDLSSRAMHFTIRAWLLADPLPYLFVLSSVAAALEPGVWGFKALWRGLQVGRGNRWKGCFIYVLLFLWDWFCDYLGQWSQTEEWRILLPSMWRILLRVVTRESLDIARSIPGFFLLPPLYFLCKSWREKVATMA